MIPAGYAEEIGPRGTGSEPVFGTDLSRKAFLPRFDDAFFCPLGCENCKIKRWTKGL